MYCCYVKNTASQGSANGSARGRPEAPKFGQLAGRSVVNTSSVVTHFRSTLKPAPGMLFYRKYENFKAAGHSCLAHTLVYFWLMADGDGPEGHLVRHLVKFLKKIFAARVSRPGHGQRLRAKVRPTGREIAARSRLAGHIGLVFHIGPRLSMSLPLIFFTLLITLVTARE